MKLSKPISGLILSLIFILSGPMFLSSPQAQQNKCKEHVVRMAQIVIQYQKTSQKLAQSQVELDELASRSDALSEEEKARFIEVRSEVLEEGSKLKDLFNAITRKSKDVNDSCSE